LVLLPPGNPDTLISSMYGLIIDINMVQTGIPLDGFLRQTTHQNRKIGPWKSLSQILDEWGGTDHIPDIIIADDQDFLDQAVIDRSNIFFPSMKKQKVIHLFKKPMQNVKHE
jgi:hypothetical protein